MTTILIWQTTHVHTLYELDDIEKFSILENGIGIECQKSTKTS